MTDTTKTAGTNCAISYHPDAFRADRPQVKGRHSAGAGFLKGFVEHGRAEPLTALTASRAHFEEFRRFVRAHDGRGREVVWARPLDRRPLRAAGAVFVPGPGLDEAAWTRRLGDERDYSLCGVTHTVASDRVVRSIGEYLVAPTQPWDALVCTSAPARAAVERIVERRAEWLERRGGGRFRSPVRLATIPLGVDCAAYAPDEGARTGLRARLGVLEGECAALFVGRLSFHAKAHPTPMYLAAERAARRLRRGRLHLLLAGQFPNEWIEREFRDAAARFCREVRVHFLDGADDALARAAWRAADIFVSLSDNVQESFGLTPIEAMAAGLPCVVSDWDGYRDTTVHGKTGFRVPSAAPGPGAGIDLADRHAAGIDTYDRYIGAASLATAVDVEACAGAIAGLAESAELRARMGAAARERALRLYDWRVVVAAYEALWAELAEARAAAAGVALRDRAREAAHADFPDPFAVFQGYPTARLGSETTVASRSRDPAGDLARLREGGMHTFAAHAFLPDAATDALLGRLAGGPARVSDLAAAHRGEGRRLARTLLWLAKFDLVELR